MSMSFILSVLNTSLCRMSKLFLLFLRCVNIFYCLKSKLECVYFWYLLHWLFVIDISFNEMHKKRSMHVIILILN